MKFAQVEPGGVNLIEAYDAASIRINGRDYGGSLAISADTLLTDWGPERVDDLSGAQLEALLAAEPQVVLIGTGARQRFLDPAVYVALLERGIGVEIMDTGAACRTYNILVSEGRRVVAALLIG